MYVSTHSLLRRYLSKQYGTQFRSMDAVRFSLQNMTELKLACACGQ